MAEINLLKAQIETQLEDIKREMVNRTFEAVMEALEPVLEHVQSCLSTTWQRIQGVGTVLQQQWQSSVPQQAPEQAAVPSAAQFQCEGVQVELSPKHDSGPWQSPPPAQLQYTWIGGSPGPHQAQINALGKGGHQRGGGQPPSAPAVFGMGTPVILSALQHHVKAPYLDPKRKYSWAQFERGWPEWAKYQSGI